VVDGVLEFLRTVAYDLLVAQQVGAPIRPSVVSGGGRATTTVSASTDTICTTSSILHVALSGVTSATTPNRQAMKTMRVDFFSAIRLSIFSWVIPLFRSKTHALNHYFHKVSQSHVMVLLE
jgi:hypothetical protein